MNTKYHLRQINVCMRHDTQVSTATTVEEKLYMLLSCLRGSQIYITYVSIKVLCADRSLS